MQASTQRIEVGQAAPAEDHAAEQAITQLECLRDLVDAHSRASNLQPGHRAWYDHGWYDEDSLGEQIQNTPLSTEVRSGWTEVGDPLEAAEYMILLCTGGPAVRITGDLGAHGTPDTATMQYQDWGTPWTDLPLDSDDEAVLVEFANCFTFDL
jgi:hypothetical protein